jgi:Transposase C of IS166 homeodomain/zinc-finger binding domain of transposase IS66
MDARVEIPNDINELKQRYLLAQMLLKEQADELQLHREDRKHHQRELHHKDLKIAALEERLRLMIHQRYGASAEHADLTYPLFDEAEATATTEPAEVDTLAVPAHTRAKRGRRALPAELPRVAVIHDLADSDKVCPHDGTALRCIGEDTSEQLDIVPATIVTVRKSASTISRVFKERISQSGRCWSRQIQSAAAR